MNIEMVINTSLVTAAEKDHNYQDNKECVTIRLADNTRMCLDITWEDYQKHVFGNHPTEIVQTVGGVPYTWDGLGVGQDVGPQRGPSSTAKIQAEQKAIKKQLVCTKCGGAGWSQRSTGELVECDQCDSCGL
jgi:hypothetical protein